MGRSPRDPRPSEDGNFTDVAYRSGAAAAAPPSPRASAIHVLVIVTCTVCFAFFRYAGHRIIHARALDLAIVPGHCLWSRLDGDAVQSADAGRTGILIAVMLLLLAASPARCATTLFIREITEYCVPCVARWPMQTVGCGLELTAVHSARHREHHRVQPRTGPRPRAPVRSAAPTIRGADACRRELAAAVAVWGVACTLQVAGVAPTAVYLPAGADTDSAPVNGTFAVNGESEVSNLSADGAVGVSPTLQVAAAFSAGRLVALMRDAANTLSPALASRPPAPTRDAGVVAAAVSVLWLGLALLPHTRLWALVLRTSLAAAAVLTFAAWVWRRAAPAAARASSWSAADHTPRFRVLVGIVAALLTLTSATALTERVLSAGAIQLVVAVRDWLAQAAGIVAVPFLARALQAREGKPWDGSADSPSDPYVAMCRVDGPSPSGPAISSLTSPLPAPLCSRWRNRVMILESPTSVGVHGASPRVATHRCAGSVADTVQEEKDNEACDEEWDEPGLLCAGQGRVIALSSTVTQETASRWRSETFSPLPWVADTHTLTQGDGDDSPLALAMDSPCEEPMGTSRERADSLTTICGHSLPRSDSQRGPGETLASKSMSPLPRPRLTSDPEAVRGSQGATVDDRGPSLSPL